MKRIALLLFVFASVAAHATVTNLTTSVSFTCTGSNGPYPFSFPIAEPIDLTVYQNGAVLVPTAYTITPVNNNFTNGGSVTFTFPCTPGGNILLLQRQTALTQTTSFVDNMPIPMKSIERGLDKLTEIVQEQTKEIDGVPFCNGFVPVNGQTVQYTTASTPNPCWQAGSGGGGGGGGTTVQINGVTCTSPCNFNSAVPAAPSQYQNAVWNVSGSSASLAIPYGTSSLRGLLACDGSTTTCSNGVISAPGASGAPAVYLNALSYGASPNFLPACHNCFATFNLTNNSQIVTVNSLSGFSYSFSSADVGKLIPFSNNGNPWTTTPFTTGPPYIATITSVSNATTFTISTPGANINTSTPYGGWGTDSTPAANACSNAAAAIGGATCAFPPVAGVGSIYFFASQGLDTFGNPMYILAPATDAGDYGQPGGGSGAAFTCTVVSGHLGTCTITNAGDGLYKHSATFRTSLSGGGCAIWQYFACGWGQVTAATNSSGSFVAAPTVVNQGFGLIGGTVSGTISPLGGDGAAATVTVSGGTTGSPSISPGGDGYGNAASINYYLLNSGGSTCATVGTAGGTSYVGRGTATANSSGVIASISPVVNATGCGATPPIVAFGDYVCNTGTYASPVWGQCANKAPLLENPIPVHVMLQPNVNIFVPTGASFDVSFYDGYDGTATDSNEPIMFAGQVQNEDLTFGTVAGYIGLYATNNANKSRVHNTNFIGPIGMYTSATDVGFTCSNLNFSGDAGWVNGGTWKSRTDAPNGNGGFFDMPECDNVVAFVSAYGGPGSRQQRLDDWFNNNFWHCEFSALSIDFAETPKCPIATSQRQTSHSLNPSFAGVQGNMGTYRGISSTALAVYARDNRNTGQGTFNGLTLKGASRYIFVGDNGSLKATNWSNEGLVPITGTGDPYRTATTQEGSIVDTAGCQQPQWNGLFTSSPSSNIQQILWSNNCQASPAGTPAFAIWNMINNSQNNVNVMIPNQNLNLVANEYFHAGATIGVNNGLPQALSWQGYVSPTTQNDVEMYSGMTNLNVPDLAIYGFDYTTQAWDEHIGDFFYYSGEGGLAMNGVVTAVGIATTNTGSTNSTSPVCPNATINGTQGYLTTSGCAAGGMTNPMTTLGDIIIENATPAPARLAGCTGAVGVPCNLTSTPTSGPTAAAPVWALPGVPGRTVATTSDTIVATDRSSTILYNDASAIAVTLTSAATLGNNFSFKVFDENTGTATFTPGAGTINGASTLAVTEGMSCVISSPDNTNYLASCGPGIVTWGAGFTATPSAFGVSVVAAGTVATGGTGASSFTAYAPVVGGTTSTAALASTVVGTSGQVFVSQGSSSKPTYIDFPERYFIPAANCNNATAGAAWSIGASGVVTCQAGTNNQGGYITITDTSSSFAQFTITIPEDWDTATNPYIRFYLETQTDTTSSHTIIPQIEVSCPTAGNGTTTSDATFSAAQSSSTITFGASVVAKGFFNSSNVQIGSTQMTGCIAGGLMIVQVGRATDTATGNINFYGADVTFPRLIAVQAN